MLRQGGDILAIEENASLIHGPDARDRVEHGGFARAVAADNGDEIAGLEVQVQTVESLLLINGAGIKGFGDVL